MARGKRLPPSPVRRGSRTALHFHALGDAAGAFVHFGAQAAVDVGRPRALEKPQRMPEHRRLVQERLGVEIDCDQHVVAFEA